MSFHDPYHQLSSPASSSSSPATWRPFPDPPFDHAHHAHRPLVLPQVPHVPRPAPNFDPDFFYDADYAFPHRAPTAHSLFPAPAHYDALHMPPAPPQGWAPAAAAHEQPFHHGAFAPFDGFPAGSAHPAPRLEPPPLHAPARALDTAAGIFYRSPEHPRLRTAQACEKCRVRKAKCSGEHPSCKRCLARGLACEYAKEGRTRGPNKAKKQGDGKKETAARTAGNDQRTASSDQRDQRIAGSGQLPAGNDQRPASTGTDQREQGSRSKPPTPDGVAHRPLEAHDPRTTEGASPRAKDFNKRMSLPTLPRPHRLSLSMGEHRAARPRPPDLRLETQSLLYRLEGDGAQRKREEGGRGPGDEGKHRADGEAVQDARGALRRLDSDGTPRRHVHSLSAGALSPGLTPRFLGGGDARYQGAAEGRYAGVGDSRLEDGRREGSYDGASSCSSEAGVYAVGGRSLDGSGSGGRSLDGSGLDGHSLDGHRSSSPVDALDSPALAAGLPSGLVSSSGLAYPVEGSGGHSAEGAGAYPAEGAGAYATDSAASYPANG
ncbi:hypothetical protein HDZ31DRAFT_21616, partial [Schizophyllum fasciatum]